MRSPVDVRPEWVHFLLHFLHCPLFQERRSPMKSSDHAAIRSKRAKDRAISIIISDLILSCHILPHQVLYLDFYRIISYR